MVINNFDLFSKAFYLPKGSRLGPTSIHLVHCVLSASEIKLLLVVILRRIVVMMDAGVNVMYQVMRDSR